MRKPAPAKTKSLIRIICPVVGALMCGHAQAENWPVSLSVTETLSRDSNLYRVEPGEYAVADTVSSTGLKFAIDKPYGRQRYRASLGTAANLYLDSENLNNTSYDLDLSASSEFLDKGNFYLSAGATQNLARFDVAGQNTVYSIKNTQNTSYASGQVSYGGYGVLTPYATINHFQQGFTYTNSNYQTMNQNTVGLGVYYAVVPQLRLGFGPRLTRGNIDYADGAGGMISNNMRRRDLDATLDWIATGLSKLNARLSSTRETDHYEPNANLLLETAKSNGWTSEIDWEYTPQGRLSYSLTFTRDQGNVGRNYDLSNTEIISGLGTTWADSGTSVRQFSENNRLSNTLKGKVTWDFSHKVKFNLAAQYTKYHLDRDQYVTTTASDGSQIDPTALPSQHSQFTQYSIGAQYQYSRWLNLYCDFKRLKRTNDAEYRAYNAMVTACTGQFTLNGMN